MACVSFQREYFVYLNEFLMKKILLLLVAWLALGGGISAQTTGKTALSLVAKARGVPAGAIMEVNGVKGQDQPAVWRVITRDPEFAGRFREYHVSNGKITAVGPLPDEVAPVINQAGLSQAAVKVDSVQAFLAANEAAQTALVGFDSVDYQLRNKEYSSDPIWLVKLADHRGQRVGEVVVSAQTGKVLQRTWVQNGRSYANSSVESASPSAPRPRATVARAGTSANRQTAPAPTTRKSVTGQEVWENARTGFNHSKEAIKTGYQKASSIIGGLINKARSGGDSEADRDSGTYDSSRR